MVRRELKQLRKEIELAFGQSKVELPAKCTVVHLGGGLDGASVRFRLHADCDRG
jgi:hypothetical protein